MRDDVSVAVEVAIGPASDDYAASMNVQVCTPPPTVMSYTPKKQARYQDEIGGISPSAKYPAFKDAAEAKRSKRSAIEKKSRLRRQGILMRMRGEVK